MNSREHDICRGYDRNGDQTISPDRRDAHIVHWWQQAANAAGLGDQVKRLTDAAGIRQCGGCQSRQAAMNVAAPSSSWLARTATSLVDTVLRKQPEQQLPTPRLDHEAWQTSTADVMPTKIATATATPFPVELRWGEQATSAVPTALYDPPDGSPIPFVYIYWATGAQGDELRWSQRSIHKYLDRPAEFIVVGAKPSWYSGKYVPVRRVPFGPNRRYRDSLNKLYQACMSDAVPDNFFWIMDDVYLITPTSFAELRRPRHYGHIPASKIGTYNVSNGWHKVKCKTFAAIHSHGLPCHEWGTHLPHWINKKRFLEIWKKYDLANQVFTWELIYGAEFYDLEEARHSRGFLNRYLKAKDLDGLSRDTSVAINNGNGAWREPLRAYLWTKLRDVDTGVDTGEVADPIWAKVPAKIATPPPAKSVAPSLAVISTHFNPESWDHTRRNARRFVDYCEQSGVRLFMAEMGFNADFVLESGPNCHITRIHADRDRHTLWQKERLLNILIEQLPPEIEHVAWVDADVQFEHADWPLRIVSELQSHKVVQLWDDVHEQLPDGSRSDWVAKPSVLSGYLASDPNFFQFNKFHPGFAWAIRRETLTKIGGLMDNNILGGADAQMCRGFFGKALFSDKLLSAAMLRSVNAWSDHTFSEVAGNVGLVAGHLIHHWHGDRRDRKYVERLRWLSAFDPLMDVEIDPETQLWQWTESARRQKAELVQRVTDYFRLRREDG